MRLSVQIEFDKTLDLVTHRSTVVVGRSSESDLVVTHGSVSRKHCKIDYENKEFYITDLGSSNGTKINGQRLPPDVKRKVPEGAVLSIGELDAELAAFIPQIPPDKLISSETSNKGDYTATIRLSRIDLNQPLVNLELEKKNTKNLKRPRNPVSAKIEEVVEEKKDHKKVIMLLLAIIVLTVAWKLGK